VQNSSTSKIARNSASNVIRGAVNFPITLALTPFVFRHLGPRDFGIWSMLYALVQSAVVFDMGLSASLVRFVAFLNARQQFSDLSHVVSTAFVSYGVLSATLLLGIGLSARSIVLHLFKISDGTLGKFTVIVMLAALALAMQLLAAVFLAFLQGLQRIDLANGVSIFVALANFTLALGALLEGRSLMGLMITHVLSAALGLVAAIAIAISVCPSVKWRPSLARLDKLREIMPLSVAIQFLNLQTLIFTQFDKFALSGILGPVSAGYYEIASRPLTAIRNIPLTIVQPVTPAVAEMQADGRRAAINQLFAVLNKYVTVMAATVFGLILFLPAPLIRLWFGRRPISNIDIVIHTMQALAITYFINLLGSISTYMAVGLGESGCIRHYAILSSSLHVILGLWMIHSLGYIGAPLAILIATTLSVAYLRIRFSRLMESRDATLLKSGVMPVSCAVAVGFMCMAIRKYLLIVDSTGHTLLLSGAYLLSLGLALVILKYFSKDEVETVRTLCVNTLQNIKLSAMQLWRSNKRLWMSTS
jgi:O-antigen/teichoic acid export membrane protein